MRQKVPELIFQHGWNVFPVAWRCGGQTEAERGGQDGLGGAAVGGNSFDGLTLSFCFCPAPKLTFSTYHLPTFPSLLAQVTLYLPVSPCPLTHGLDIPCFL